MAQHRTAPTGWERHFGTDEVIVTKTDLRGVITYANDVFLRVSALVEAETIGQPHNLIRHPDMPRTVFDLLWSTVQDGRELFAYVCNLAADGAHYWVLAHVTPTTDTAGRVVAYHSSRRLPAAGALAVIRPLYADIRAEEHRHPRPADALAAGTALLQRRLDAVGLTYDEYVWSLSADRDAA
jgi:PAS domain S-box-containing protein